MGRSTVVGLALFLVAIVGAYETVQPMELSRVDSNAIWASAEKHTQELHKQCMSLAEPVAKCLLAVMEKSGASPQAVRFAEMIDNIGYLRDFRKAGQVDIAYVAYPFRANENYGYLLVNGVPMIVDVDNLKALPSRPLESDPKYKELLRNFPNAAIWPGDRYGTQEPVVQRLPNGGQRFVVEYRLTDLCHACEVLGKVKFGFNFDLGGKFEGIIFVRLE